MRFALLLLFATPSWACSCSAWASIKETWKSAPAVFLGTVELATPDGGDSDLTFQEQSGRVRVDEAFKGVFGGQIIELDEGANDCAAKFKTGERAVFYLYSGPKHSWFVRPCSRALASADPYGDDLLILRALPKSAIGTRLSGSVEVYEDSPEGIKTTGIPDVRVNIFGPQGASRQLVTNSSGVYEIYGLRPGQYSVTLEVPSGLIIRFPYTTGSENAVELGKDGAASVDFELKPDTQLSGHLLDRNGIPVAKTWVELEPLQGRSRNAERFFDCTDASGIFRMTMMPPGKYRLVAQDEVTSEGAKSKSTLYYPGVREQEKAAIISVEAASYLDYLDIRLPSNEKRYKLQGQFQFADGAPVTKATVTFRSPQSGYSETTTSDVDGSFGLSVVAGMSGQLSGDMMVFERSLRFCPEYQVEPERRGLLRFMPPSPFPSRPIPIARTSNSNLRLGPANLRSRPSGRSSHHRIA